MWQDVRVCASCGHMLKLQNIVGTHQQCFDFIMTGHKAAMNAGVKAFPSMSWRNAAAAEMRPRTVLSGDMV